MSRNHRLEAKCVLLDYYGTPITYQCSLYNILRPYPSVFFAYLCVWQISSKSSCCIQTVLIEVLQSWEIFSPLKESLWNVFQTRFTRTRFPHIHLRSWLVFMFRLVGWVRGLTFCIHFDVSSILMIFSPTRQNINITVLYLSYKNKLQHATVLKGWYMYTATIKSMKWTDVNYM